jgi:hypothetical protein
VDVITAEIFPHHPLQPKLAKDAIVTLQKAAMAQCTQDQNNGHHPENEPTTETPGGDAVNLALKNGDAIVEKDDTASVDTAAAGALIKIEFQRKGVLQRRMPPVTVIAHTGIEQAHHAMLSLNVPGRSLNHGPISPLASEA